MVDNTERFTNGGSTTETSQCNTCAHFKHTETPTCDAYPDRIPPEILVNDVLHTTPYKGDHGIQFAERKGG